MAFSRAQKRRGGEREKEVREGYGVGREEVEVRDFGPKSAEAFSFPLSREIYCKVARGKFRV
jgi:hypothetical protein